MTPLEEIKQMNSLIEDINKILTKNGINEKISLSDITVTDKTISDLVKPHAKLSDAIIDFLWPSIPKATVYHFTSKETAEAILKTELFRLYNIEKRYCDDEVKIFCETHQLTGYLEKNDKGEPKYKSLIMPNTYYSSFTDINLTTEQENYFWSTFATSDGVRLKLEITASNPNFRKVRYKETAGKQISLLSDLSECVRNKYSKEFILKGISR